MDKKYITYEDGTLTFNYPNEVPLTLHHMYDIDIETLKELFYTSTTFLEPWFFVDIVEYTFNMDVLLQVVQSDGFAKVHKMLDTSEVADVSNYYENLAELFDHPDFNDIYTAANYDLQLTLTVIDKNYSGNTIGEAVGKLYPHLEEHMDILAIYLDDDDIVDAVYQKLNIELVIADTRVYAVPSA